MTSQMHKLRHVRKKGQSKSSSDKEVQRGDGKATKTSGDLGTRAVEKSCGIQCEWETD
jgi:hypothetical protein